MCSQAQLEHHAGCAKDKLRHLSGLLARAQRVAFLSSTQFTASASKLRDVLVARKCDVVAGLEGETPEQGTAIERSGLEGLASHRPTKKSKSELLQATKPVDVVLLLGSAPTSAKNFNPKSRPGPLQIAAAAVMAAVSEKAPLFTIADAPETTGSNVFRGGPSLVEELTALVQTIPQAEPTESEKCWEEASCAARSDDAKKLRDCLGRRPELRAGRDAEGRTLLHLAGAAGACLAAEALLDIGVAWHVQDKLEVTAGEEALFAGHQEMFDKLVARAAAAERAERQIRDAKGGDEPAPKRHCSAQTVPYLQQELLYQDGKLLDAHGCGVMMGWEAPLMAKHAQLLRPANADVLNVGFGLGLVDGFLQEHHPRSHTIVEAHPDVLQEVRRQGWYEKPGVSVREGRWQDVVNQFPAASFDAIFYDTYEETYVDLRAFLTHVPRLLRQGGRVSFFNGMAPYNIFYHAVYCRMAQEDLLDLGLECDYCSMEIGDLGDSTWQGVAQKYWSFRTYYLPLATIASPASLHSSNDGSVGVTPIVDSDSWRRWPSNAVRVGDAVGPGVDVGSEYWTSPPPSDDECSNGDSCSKDQEVDAIFDEILNQEHVPSEKKDSVS